MNKSEVAALQEIQIAAKGNSIGLAAILSGGAFLTASILTVGLWVARSEGKTDTNNEKIVELKGQVEKDREANSNALAILLDRTARQETTINHINEEVKILRAKGAK